MQIDGALKVFSQTAGIQSAQLSLLIRVTLLGGFFLWAAWCVIELMKYYKTYSHASIGNLLKDYVQVFFLVSVVISLVFIK